MATPTAPPTLRVRWMKLAWPARYAIAYLVVLVLALALALALRVSVGTPLFLGAVVCVIASAALIRGGSTRMGRGEQATLRRMSVDPEDRSAEDLFEEHARRRLKDIRLGLRLFALGALLAASAVGSYFLGF